MEISVSMPEETNQSFKEEQETSFDNGPTIPGILNQGQKLEVLSLSSQELSALPKSLLRMKCFHVGELYLDYNTLEKLPSVLCENLASCLCKLSVVGNQLSELPAAIHSLTRLEELYLNENELEQLPSTIVTLRNLRILNIVGNNIQKLPSEFGQLVNLEKFYADENRLEHLPETFGLLLHLDVAEISHNRIRELPRNFGLLQQLKVLNLSNNQLKSLPDSFSSLANVEELDFSNNLLEHLPDTLKSCSTLRKLYVEDNSLHGLPRWVGELPEILEFIVKNNRLQGSPLPEALGFVSIKLRKLDLGGNFISKLPESLGNLKLLEKLHLGSVIDELERRAFQNGNWLYDLPNNFGQLTALCFLRLDENQLTELPKEFGNLVHLQHFDIGQNRLLKLPESFSNLRSLRVCQLSKNSLRLLPVNFGNLQSLEDLRLDNNQITELPESFGCLTQLRSLDLFNNCLTVIPECLTKLKDLRRLDLNENHFEMDHNRVPEIRAASRYAPRDPVFSNNWRGKGRQDLVEVEITEVPTMEPDEECRKIIHEVEEELSTPYSSSAMRYATNKNLSLWRSHTGPKIREKYIRPPEALHNALLAKEEERKQFDEVARTRNWMECNSAGEELKEDLEDETRAIKALRLHGDQTEENHFPSGFLRGRGAAGTEEEQEPPERTVEEEDEEEEDEEEDWSDCESKEVLPDVVWEEPAHEPEEDWDEDLPEQPNVHCHYMPDMPGYNQSGTAFSNTPKWYIPSLHECLPARSHPKAIRWNKFQLHIEDGQFDDADI